MSLDDLNREQKRALKRQGALNDQGQTDVPPPLVGVAAVSASDSFGMALTYAAFGFQRGDADVDAHLASMVRLFLHGALAR